MTNFKLPSLAIFLACMLCCPIGIICQQVVTTTGCDVSKGCVRWPNSCTSSVDCLSLITFTIKPQGSNNTVVFEMSGRTDAWVAFGLNPNKRRMGNTIGHACVKGNSGVELHGFENEGTHTKMKALDSSVVLTASSSVNGSLVCIFERLIEARSYMRPLDSSWYIVGAWGTKIHYNDAELHLDEHALEDVFWTEGEFDLRFDVSKPASSFGYKTILAHAACMVLAWMFFSTIGMFVARYTRRDIDKKEVAGQKLWFVLHRVFMVLAVLLTIAGTVIIFLEVEGWSMEAGVHPYLGILLVLLTLVQPIAGVLRPSLDSPRRKMFEWGHWGGGLMSILLSIALMLSGLALMKVPVYMPIIFVVCSLVIIVAIEAVRLTLARRSTASTTESTDKLEVEDAADPLRPMLRRMRIYGLPLISIVAGIIAIVQIYVAYDKLQTYIDKAQ